ncbi:MAG TPA: GDP-mannose 4,6-dehydratase [Candidatus Elarobacter sp.]|nr:GDP-mannose 4,6-dehydratase [Candidatus Elarobacter sp.]
MRVLVTGASGFVGRHLVAALRARDHDVFMIDHLAHGDVLGADVTDASAVDGAMELAQPDAVAHLAAQAFVPASLDDPAATLNVNVGGTLNVLAAARRLRDAGRSVRVLVTSSAEVYGAQPSDAYPLRETTATRPANPYAASKVAAEALVSAYARSFGVDAVVTRAFNHIGPGQDERFAVPAFALQLARIVAGGDAVVRVGNLTAERDLLDVRDVCEAYALLLEGGGAAGEIYNVCSGTATPMREILRRLIEIAHVPVEVREDPERMRPADVPVSVGDATKLREATGWTPKLSLVAALRDVYDEARARLASTAPR